MSFQRMNLESTDWNPFRKIGKEWMLITAGSCAHNNTMTASWGGLGVLWGKNTATAYIRPQRYTKEFVDQNDIFTLSFFHEKYRPALSLCGTVSGKDRDKIQEAGLTPAAIDQSVTFEEADCVLVCRKLYHDNIVPEHFDDQDQADKWYPEEDFHTFYIGEIIAAYKNM